jgi:hypothetical protein
MRLVRRDTPSPQIYGQEDKIAGAAPAIQTKIGFPENSIYSSTSPIGCLSFPEIH